MVHLHLSLSRHISFARSPLTSPRLPRASLFSSVVTGENTRNATAISGTYTLNNCYFVMQTITWNLTLFPMSRQRLHPHVTIFQRSEIAFYSSNNKSTELRPIAVYGTLGILGCRPTPATLPKLRVAWFTKFEKVSHLFLAPCNYSGN